MPRSLALGVGPPVLVRKSRVPLEEAHIDVRVIALIIGHFARTHLENHRIPGRAILQMMSVVGTRRMAAAANSLQSP